MIKARLDFVVLNVMLQEDRMIFIDIRLTDSPVKIKIIVIIFRFSYFIYNANISFSRELKVKREKGN